MRVLDVGSGGRPHAAATHLCDALEENLERGSDLKRDGRPFVYAEIDHLPFKGGAFDFVYAVHVLEHSPAPQAALDELTRVAKAGYIETPTPFAERLYGWTNHRATVSFKGGRFVFGPKVEPQRTLDMHKLYRVFPVWKAIHKGLDLVLNVLYVRVLFRRQDEGVSLKSLGRGQAIYDLVHDPLVQGVGPPPS